MNEEIKKNLPYILGGGVILAGIYFFIKGTGNTQGIGYTAIAPQDNSAALQAQSSQNLALIQAKSQGFLAVTQLMNNEMIADYDYRTQTRQSELNYLGLVDTNQTAIQLRNIDSDTQQMNIRASESTAKHDSNTRAIASIVGTIGMIALFCYDPTFEARQKLLPYHHGMGVDYA